MVCRSSLPILARVLFALVSAVTLAACLQEPAADYNVRDAGSADAGAARDAGARKGDASLDAKVRASN